MSKPNGSGSHRQTAGLNSRFSQRNHVRCRHFLRQGRRSGKGQGLPSRTNRLPPHPCTGGGGCTANEETSAIHGGPRRWFLYRRWKPLLDRGLLRRLQIRHLPGGSLKSTEGHWHSSTHVTENEGFSLRRPGLC